MPLPTSKKTVGLGRSIINRRAKEAQNRNQSTMHTTDLINPSSGGPGLRSVTHQGDLEEFLSTAQLADADFTAERRNVTVVQGPGGGAGGSGGRGKNPFLLSNQEEREVLGRQNQNRKKLRVPRRPEWDSKTTPEQLRKFENESFLEWRRNLAVLTEANNFVMTPFERNLEVWRQLWRVVERSHLVIQIVDARNPLRFRCEDLEKYVEEIKVRLGGKAKGGDGDDEDEEDEEDEEEDDENVHKKGRRRNLLLINKADLLDDGQRQEWSQYFEEQGIEYAFFSAANAAALQAARAEAEAAAEAAEYYNAVDQEEEDGEEGSGKLVEAESDSDEDEDVRAIRQQAAAVEVGAKATRVLVGQEAASHILEANHERVQEALRKERSKGPNDVVEATPTADAAAIREGDHTTADKFAKDPTRVLNVLELEELFMAKAPPLEDFETEEYGIPSKLVVGLVGYPNVGKSSTINALLGEKKVSVSATPGKTKHFQTIALSNSVTLCDCPGLVFPQFATTSAELVLDGVLPIDQMREYTAPGELIARRIPKDILEGTYGFRIAIENVEEGGSGQPTGLEVLTAYAIARGFARQGQGNPDESRAARYVFKDYVNAKLLYAHPPPGLDGDDFNEEQRERARVSLAGRKLAPITAADAAMEGDEELASSDAKKSHVIPGKKSKALDSAFFNVKSNGFMTTGRGTVQPGQSVFRGRINPDGTEAAAPSPTNKQGAPQPPPPGIDAGKKHFKANKRKKNRSGQGYV
ncbi:hypothetical protein CBS101457_002633 [Exobasidium rhododendri]|nr:hypothetical protein CBS101457_002633 [Exobasidium rhododendri]